MKKGEAQTWELSGFSFSDEETAKQAEKEAEAVKYVKGSVDMDNPDMVFEMYNGLLEQGIFKTPVGYAYLKELQDYLVTIPYIMNHHIKPIPVMGKAEPPKIKAEKQPKKAAEKTEKPKQVKQITAVNVDYKKRFKTAFSVCVVLVIMVIAMFAITLTSGNTTILNYENKIIDKYESWEQELNEREAALEEKEAGME